VLGVWSRVLGHEVTSPTLSFFEAGGNSLLVLNLYASLREEFGPSFEIRDLFRLTTARSFVSTVLEGIRRDATPARPSAIRASAERLGAIADRRRSMRRERQ
jgi:hypothetical protein